MATFDFRTTLEYADGLCDGTRLVDFREKTKHIKKGDVIHYTPWWRGKEVRGHAVTGKKWKVVYVDGDDPRVMKNFDLICLEEIIPEWE